MKKSEIMSKASSVLYEVSFKLKKHSPEIFVVAGIASTVAGAVLACKATIKALDVVEDTKEKMDIVHTSAEKGCTAMGAEYSKEDEKKDTVVVYTQTGVKMAKLYAPAVIAGTLGITCILASNGILRKRNAGLTAAYAAIDKGFKEYRKHVVERFGEDVDHELRHGIKASKITETVTDEKTGKEKKVEKDIPIVNGRELSGYARLFEKYTENADGDRIDNPHWDNSMDYNLMFLKAREREADALLIANKRLFLNDVYEMLGFPRTKAGQVVGWTYNPQNQIGDNYVSFGLYNDSVIYTEGQDGKVRPAILLDFNVDGNIWEQM